MVQDHVLVLEHPQPETPDFPRSRRARRSVLVIAGHEVNPCRLPTSQRRRVQRQLCTNVDQSPVTAIRSACKTIDERDEFPRRSRAGSLARHARR